MPRREAKTWTSAAPAAAAVVAADSKAACTPPSALLTLQPVTEAVADGRPTWVAGDSTEGVFPKQGQPWVCEKTFSYWRHFPFLVFVSIFAATGAVEIDTAGCRETRFFVCFSKSPGHLRTPPPEMKYKLFFRTLEHFFSFAFFGGREFTRHNAVI